jgi:hypothetical protein
MSAKRFRVAFSFAGEKRDFVSQVAGILAKQFGKEAVLYDKYHKAEFSRGDLAFYLPDLYESQADLVVAVFCPDYDKKEWCGLEWNAMLAEKLGRQELVGGNCRSLAKALVRQGRSAEAVPYARRAVEIYTRLAHPALEFARETLRECEA